MRQSTKLFSLSLPVVLLSLVAGCGGKDTLARKEIFGKVTYKNEPVLEGDISFLPAEGVATPGTSAPIKDGEYRATGEAGLAAGTYRVRINAYRPAENQKPMLSPGGLDRPPIRGGFKDQYLPEKFNKNSSIENIVVESKADKVEKNFDLKD